MENNIFDIKIWEKPQIQVLASKYTSTDDECRLAGKIGPYDDGTLDNLGASCGIPTS